MKQFALLLVVLSALTLGCKLSGMMPGGAGASNSSGGSSGSGSAKAGADPRAEVVAAATKFNELKFMTANMEGVGQNEMKSRVSYVAPDRYHVEYLGGTGAGMEMIIVGPQMYMKPAGGKWNKMGDAAASLPTLRDSFTEEGLKSLNDAKYEGDDTVNGKAASVYSYKNVTPKGAYPFTAKIWISKDTGLPMKLVAEYSNGVLKQMTVTYDTETPVTIEAPIS